MNIQSKSKKQTVRNIVIAVLLVVAAAAVLIISYNKSKNIPDWQDVYQQAGVYAKVGDGISVSYIDVGQGDSIFIEADGCTVLIDAGERKNAEEITAFLDRYDVDTLDLVVATHFDADHIGGMSAIVRNYEIGSFITARVEDRYQSTTQTSRVLLDTLKSNDIDVQYVTSGQTYTFGAMKLDVLSPGCEYKNTNDDSVVVRVRYGDSRFLFMGDASSRVEKRLMEEGVDVDADVLKVTHHGSRTGTSFEFLDAVAPEVSVVSVGEDNSYNLPNIEVMRRLEDFGCDVYRTDEDGTVTVNSDGENITVKTEK